MLAKSLFWNRKQLKLHCVADSQTSDGKDPLKVGKIHLLVPEHCGAYVPIDEVPDMLFKLIVISANFQQIFGFRVQNRQRRERQRQFS